MYPPDIAYADQFAQAQDEAQANERGLWDACVTPTPTPTATATATATTPPQPPTPTATQPSQNCCSAYLTVSIRSLPPDLDGGDITFR